MPFNLLVDPWLPVVCADGSRRQIAPWELVAEPIPLALDPPRPDFRAALLEFLVGLLATVHSPKNSNEWLQRLKSPPSPEALQAAMEPFLPCFALLGERPLFMQDLVLPVPATPREVVRDSNRVDQLLMDSPGDKTLTDCTDFFVKRGQVDSLCPACAAMALYTLQTFAPSGGAGHRTSLRGGGPLSTLARARSGAGLWHDLWMNVLPRNAHGTPFPAPTPESKGLFPWMEPTRTSEPGGPGEIVQPDEMHPLHGFWGMPRRIVLLSEESATPTACSLCGQASRTSIRHYVTKNYGYNYGDLWNHPLTPYRKQDPGKPELSVKGGARITGYQHWLGVVYGERSDANAPGKGDILPARCIQHARRALRGEALEVSVCGYDMDNMKPLQWVEGIFPVYAVSEEHLADYRAEVALLVQAAQQAARNLVGCLKDALLPEGERKKAGPGTTALDNAVTMFWSATERDFYALAATLASPEADPAAIKGRWFACLLREAERVFRQLALSTFNTRLVQRKSESSQSRRMLRQVEALGKLQRFNKAALGKLLLPARPAKGKTP